MNIYELCKEQTIIRRSDVIIAIVEFAVNHRGWSKDEALLLAVDILDSGKTIRKFVADFGNK